MLFLKDYRHSYIYNAELWKFNTNLKIVDLKKYHCEDFPNHKLVISNIPSKIEAPTNMFQEFW